MGVKKKSSSMTPSNSPAEIGDGLRAPSDEVDGSIISTSDRLVIPSKGHILFDRSIQALRLFGYWLSI